VTRGHISVRGEVYDRLKAHAEAQGVSITQLVEAMVSDVVLASHGSVTKVVRAPVEPVVEPRPFLCAVCARSTTGIPTREPFGRGGAMVDVCASCANDPPRAW